MGALPWCAGIMVLWQEDVGLHGNAAQLQDSGQPTEGPVCSGPSPRAEAEGHPGEAACQGHWQNDLLSGCHV
eukprot:957984-Lingulodinium_polyedra.AAC.1